MPTKYICDHCNKEPLYLKKGRCPECGNEATKIHVGVDLARNEDRNEKLLKM
jgi:Zn finger protein HypA/HybF involved in hydrogenase expression